MERLTESEDLTHVTFVKATDGLVLISTTSIHDVILAMLEEYESGMADEEQTADAIASSLNSEEARTVLEQRGGPHSLGTETGPPPYWRPYIA